jgi:acyl carrier protein
MIRVENSPSSRQAIESWITQWIARELALPVEQIEASKSLLNYSLSSVTAMMLVGDLEEWLEITLPPTLVWDYPSIEAIVDYLIGSIPGASTMAGNEPAAESAGLAAAAPAFETHASTPGS